MTVSGCSVIQSLVWFSHRLFAFVDTGWNQVRGTRAEWPFLKESFLSRNTLIMIEQMRDQFRSLLADIGFVEKRRGGKGGKGGKGRRTFVEPYNVPLIKAVLCGGLFPNVAVAPKALVEGEKKASECSLGSHHGVVYLHPSCVNFETPKLDSRFLIYNEVIKTSKGNTQTRYSTHAV